MLTLVKVERYELFLQDKVGLEKQSNAAVGMENFDGSGM